MPPVQTASTDLSPEITSTELRGAMGRFATGVTVITARDAAGKPVGTTVSAVSSLSLDPPLVLVCLDRKSQTLAAVRDHGAFAVNVLGAQHQDVSNAFARSANHAAWEGLDHVDAVTGSPLLGDAHVALDCRIESIAEGGDHEILIGRVVDLRHGADDAEPLLYYGGKYHALAGPDAEQVAEREEQARAEAEAVDADLPTRDGRFRIVAHERTDGDLTAALVHGDPATHAAPVVHAHEACLFGDVLGGLACDCGAQLAEAQQAILDAGAGVLLYTKRTGSDAFLCAAGRGPDIAVGAGLLARIGVRRAAFVDQSSQSARALRAAARLEVVAAPQAAASPEDAAPERR
ncbi:MAG: flavin reductase, partial [Solirubrobacteraceae bacterium]|nr:flavin reductase [Patulibacter sp.]